jgi:hypothetical protein
MNEYAISFINNKKKLETIIVTANTYKEALTIFEKIISYKQFIDCKLISE